MELHLHLSLSFKVLGLLVRLGDAASLDLILQLMVLFINAPLLGQRILDLIVAHQFLVIEVLDARVGYADVNLNKVSLLPGLVRLSLRLLGQVAIVELASLHILDP